MLSTGQATVHDNYAWNKIAGNYSIKMKDAMFLYKVDFKISNKGKIEATFEGEEVLDKGIHLVRSENGPFMKGHQVFTVILSDGSDEETHDIHIRLSLIEDTWKGKAKLIVLDVIESINEGPNNASGVSFVKQFELTKFNKISKKFEKVEVLK